LTSNIYLDIPPVISGVRNSFEWAESEPTKIILSEELLKILRGRKPDPKDPSSVVKVYLQPWWTRAAEWEKVKHELCDVNTAFDFQLEKVSWVPQSLAPIEMLR